MNWDSEIDLVAGPRPPAKQGRRAGNRETQSPRETEDAPPVVRGGWSDEGKKSAKYNSSANLIDNDQTKEADDIDDIPVIPDIDDIQDDAILQEIKPAKQPITNNIYKELETELSSVGPLLQKQDAKMNEIETQLTDLYQEIMRPFKNFEVDDNEEWTVDYLFQKHIKAAHSTKM